MNEYSTQKPNVGQVLVWLPLTQCLLPAKHCSEHTACINAVFAKAPWSGYCYSHPPFADEETEPQRGSVNCSKPYIWHMITWDSNPDTCLWVLSPVCSLPVSPDWPPTEPSITGLGGSIEGKSGHVGPCGHMVYCGLLGHSGCRVRQKWLVPSQAVISPEQAENRCQTESQGGLALPGVPQPQF